MKKHEIEFWRKRDINPPTGYRPAFEMFYRKRRLDEARILAEKNGVEVSLDLVESTAQLFNLYYDQLLIDLSEKSR